MLLSFEAHPRRAWAEPVWLSDRFVGSTFDRGSLSELCCLRLLHSVNVEGVQELSRVYLALGGACLLTAQN